MFRFPLQALLQHRIFIEERLQRELADCRRAYLAAMLQLDHWRQEQVNQAERFQARAADGVLPMDAIAHHRFMSRLAASEADQTQVVENSKRDMALKRSDLLEAIKQRKTLEKLKTKQAQAHRDAHRKKEQAFLSEMAITRFNRHN